MNPSDSRIRHQVVMSSDSVLLATARRYTHAGLSGSWTICLRPPSHHTPRSSVTAHTRCFVTDAGFAIVGRLAAPTS